jgi:ABC-2 type transport system ATP-binding protein
MGSQERDTALVDAQPMAGPSALEFSGVRKRHGRITSLDGVSLRIRSGAFFGLVGVNGAGKTTLLKCLLDADRADAGAIAIFGRPSTLVGARAAIAYLPERFSAPFYLRGREFLRLMATFHGHAHDEDRVAATLAALDLDPGALCRPVRDYSKGMTQKLGLAACLLSGRPLLVLDEPASGLDPRARALLKAALRARHAQGTTVFFTSHALADVQEMCDEMAILHAGHLRFTGSPVRLLQDTGVQDLEAAFLACIR